MSDCNPPTNIARRVFIPTVLQQLDALPEDADYFVTHGLSMGTSWNVKAMLPARFDRVQLHAELQAKLDLVVQQMSPWLEQSNLMQFNLAPAQTWHVIPNEFDHVLSHAIFVAEQTTGAFDPTIGHLSNLWGFGPNGKIAERPDDTEIQQALQDSGWRRLQYDHTKQRIFQPGNLHIDLCSTAKGFGVDLLARHLQTEGIVSYLVEVGGELRGLGCKADGQPWWVELEAPTSDIDAGRISDVVALHGLSIATSGDYRRYFEQAGQRYSHTIDPRTGMPVQHGLAAVTVLHPECMIADALATAISVLGPDAGMRYAERLNVAARLIVRENSGIQVHLSPALTAMLDEMND
ncbi:FAD:protein FMN transferase [Undibacterium fentianense]|uniref:FAD:protein FMN transferase n=1 Tax=Undibacterium fentianense TaxID=2828728 RepID=A0A941IGC6_9BURK|nr:FAD:protein FMN transferase [Undibacterium fentianense]MBR7799875.1 FAD:protein FMN transferase [Undibacterium fentianense]